MKKILSRISSSTLMINSIIVFAGSMTANVASYIYHLLMGRLLGPSGYGELSSLFSILYLFTVPLIVAQAVLVKIISGYKAHGEEGQAKTLLIKLTKLFVLGSLIGLPIAIVFSSIVASFLHLSSGTSFLLIYVLFIFSLLTIPLISTLQGYQKFIWFSIFSGGTIVVKLFLSIPMARWGVMGVLVAALLSAIVVYVLYYFPLRFVIGVSGKPTELDKRKTIAFALPTLLTLLGITSMYSTDIILVRHYFSSLDAGMYAALAILGKIIFYASSAVSMVVYPMLSEQSAKGNVSKKIIISSIAGVSGISAVLTAIYFFIPNVIVGMLFGNAYTNAASYLGQFGIFIGLFSVGNIISMMCLAIGKTKAWILPFSASIVQVVAIMIFHENILQIININILISALFACGVLVYIYSINYEKI